MNVNEDNDDQMAAVFNLTIIQSIDAYYSVAFKLGAFNLMLDIESLLRMSSRDFDKYLTRVKEINEIRFLAKTINTFRTTLAEHFRKEGTNHYFEAESRSFFILQPYFSRKQALLVLSSRSSWRRTPLVALSLLVHALLRRPPRPSILNVTKKSSLYLLSCHGSRS